MAVDGSLTNGNTHYLCRTFFPNLSVQKCLWTAQASERRLNKEVGALEFPASTQIKEKLLQRWMDIQKENGVESPKEPENLTVQMVQEILKSGLEKAGNANCRQRRGA